VIHAAVMVAARPTLWRTAVRQYRRTVPPRWWARAPFLPLPDARYVRFRLVTQYGVNDRAPEASDVLNYLLWCKRWEQAS
jgi:hypothetical protein